MVKYLAEFLFQIRVQGNGDLGVVLFYVPFLYSIWSAGEVRANFRLLRESDYISQDSKSLSS